MSKSNSIHIEDDQRFKSSILGRLFEYLPHRKIVGQYIEEHQTWSHRDSKVFSPVKNSQEM